MTVGAGVRIVDEGARGYSFYVLLEGGAEVSAAAGVAGRLEDAMRARLPM